jgi:hypothetical protein
MRAPRPAAPNGGPGLATRTEQDGAHDRLESYQKTDRLSATYLCTKIIEFHKTSSARASSVGGTVRPSALAAVIRRSCYNKAHDLEHGFHTPALLGES